MPINNSAWTQSEYLSAQGSVLWCKIRNHRYHEQETLTTLRFFGRWRCDHGQLRAAPIAPHIRQEFECGRTGLVLGGS